MRSNRSLYRSCPKHTKLLVAKAIVQAIQQQDPPGRFIKLREYDDGKRDSKEWVSITYAQAVNKTSQALREKETRESNKYHKGKRKQKELKQEASTTERKPSPSVDADSGIGEETIKSEGMQNPRDQQNSSTKQAPQRVGQKRKMIDSFVKPDWWRASSKMNQSENDTGDASARVSNDSSSSAAPETIAKLASDKTRSKRTNSSSESGKIGIIDNAENNVSNMGRGIVKQVMQPSQLTQTNIEATPLPVETTLGSRQSSMFRFFNNSGIFGWGAPVAPAFNRGTTAPYNVRSNEGMINQQGINTSKIPLESTPWAQQVRAGSNGSSAIRSDRRTGQDSLAYSRVNGNKSSSSAVGLGSDMQEISTMGLMDNCDDTAHPPPPKRLKAQMSDWLNSFMSSPPTKVTRPQGSVNNFKSSQTDVDNDGAAIPPPPGGGGGLGRSVSSAIFDLVESPSLLLTSLKAGVSSMFGGSTIPQSSFQQQMQRMQTQKQQQQQNIMQQQRNFGNQPVLGERAKQRSSLLEDFEETPMEMELRNAKS